MDIYEESIVACNSFPSDAGGVNVRTTLGEPLHKKRVI